MNYFKDEENLVQNIEKLMESSLIKKLPGSVKNKILNELKEAREYIYESRPPRFAVIGRRGAGKSSLINAITGRNLAEVSSVEKGTRHGKWYLCADKRGSIEILDTRGLGDGSLEGETSISLKEAKEQVSKKCPDVFLFLSKAKEVEARLEEDLEQLKELSLYAREKFNYAPPIVGVVTQVDELDPPDICDPPFEDKEKKENIERSKNILKNKIKWVIDDPVDVIPVSTYARYDEKGNTVYSRIWNVEVLMDCLLEKIPNSAALQMARVARSKKIKKDIAHKVSKPFLGTAFAIGGNPIPLSDMPLLISLQITMVGTIAYIGGKEISRKLIMDFLAALGLNVGTGYLLRQVARSMLKSIPGAGHIISGTIAYMATRAISKAAIAYYIEGVSLDKAKEILQSRLKDKDGEDIKS